MDKKGIVVPIAVHMDNPLFHFLGKMTGVTLKPIVTKNTLKKEKYENRKLNDGMDGYLDKSISSLKEGKVVVLAPQGERMSHLGQPSNLAIRTLMKQAAKADLENYAFLFIGFEIKGITDYSKKNVGGFNLSKQY